MKTVIVGMGPMGIRHIKSVSRVNGLELVAVTDLSDEQLSHAI